MQPLDSATIPVTDGLLVAAIREDGVWGALCALRDGMRELAVARPRTSFVAAVTDEGKLVGAQDPQARVLILGYRAR